MKVVWAGNPGDVYTNAGETIVYQLHCSLINTCGACFQYHLAIAKWWSKFHHGCNCQVKPIYPGKSAEPYADWRRMIADLPEEERARVMGKAAHRLVEKGVVKFEDVVTSSRVRLLREVVSRQQLTVEQMTKAGVKPQTAREAFATVNTPAHQLAARQRAGLVRQVLDAGIKPQHLTEMFGEQMARRVAIAAGPSKSSPMPAGRTRADWLRVLIPTAALKVPTIARFAELAARADVPTRTIDDRAEADRLWKGGIDAIPCTYSWTENAVLINPHASLWSDPRWLVDLAAAGYFSSGSADHPAWHEIAHYKHAQAITPEKLKRLSKVVPKDRAAIAEQVSGYAATSWAEFVAEVYAGMKAGKSYPAGVMRQYRKLLGPEP